MTARGSTISSSGPKENQVVLKFDDDDVIGGQKRDVRQTGATTRNSFVSGVLRLLYPLWEENDVLLYNRVTGYTKQSTPEPNVSLALLHSWSAEEDQFHFFQGPAGSDRKKSNELGF